MQIKNFIRIVAYIYWRIPFIKACIIVIQFINPFQKKILIPNLKNKLYLNKISDIYSYYQIFLLLQCKIKTYNDPQIIIDCGANIGLSTIFFKNSYPNAKIFSIEPDQENFSRLKDNIKKYDNIIPINKAIWYKECLLANLNTGSSNTALIL